MTSHNLHATTILTVRRGTKIAMGGDGQVTLGDSVVKGTARKIRRIDDYKILAGFAGAAADGFTLMEKFEGKLEAYSGNLKRAAIELAKDWRSDKMLRQLEAMLLAADKKETFLISGNGDVIAPDDEVAAIGSGGNYALAAAKALHAHTRMAPAGIVRAAMGIAGNICIYTNSELVLEELS